MGVASLYYVASGEYDKFKVPDTVSESRETHCVCNRLDDEGRLMIRNNALCFVFPCSLCTHCSMLYSSAQPCALCS